MDSYKKFEINNDDNVNLCIKYNNSFEIKKDYEEKLDVLLDGILSKQNTRIKLEKLF